MGMAENPIVKVQMLIRRPVAEVFNAFVDPAVTTNFWFSQGSDRLEPGQTVRWEWAAYGFGVDVAVKEVVANHRIVIEWDAPPQPVTWEFEPRGGDTTLVKITTSGFAGSLDEIVARAMDSQGGFSYVLAGAKAWLEHGINLNLVADHHPDAGTEKE